MYDPRRISVARSGGPGDPPRAEPWWAHEDDNCVASEANIDIAYATYHARETEQGPEVAFVTWWYGSPTLKALFRGVELVAGELCQRRGEEAE